MERAMRHKGLFKFLSRDKANKRNVNNLAQGRINTAYTILGIETLDQEMENFLFTLGCYEGEIVTIISILADNYVIAVKDARYSIDKDLASAIRV